MEVNVALQANADYRPQQGGDLGFRAGDVIEVEADGIGVLTNGVIDEQV